MRRPLLSVALGVALAALGLAIACNDEVVGPEGPGSITLVLVSAQPEGAAPALSATSTNPPAPAAGHQLATPDGGDSVLPPARVPRSPDASAAFDNVHVAVSGPTNREMNLVLNTGTNRWEGVITGLNPGQYGVVVEGLVGGEVDHLGATAGVQVRSSDTTVATVSWNPFRTQMADPSSPTRLFSIPVSFGAITGASSYWIQWTTDQFFNSADSVSVSGTSATILVGSTGTYWIRVRASSGVTTAPGRPSDPKSVQIAADTMGGANPASAFGLTGDQALDSLNVDATFPEDWFALSVCEADTLTVETIAARPPVSSGLDPFLVLLNAAGDTVQADANAAGGVDAKIDAFGIPADGVYKIGVSAENGTAGNYQLVTDTATGPHHDPVDPTQCDRLAQLVFAVPPSNDTAGSTIDPAIQVEARDAQGTPILDFTDVITIALGTDPTGGSATLSGTLDVSASNGIATFSDLVLDRAATGYTLVASARRATSGPSNTFDIVAGAPATLAIESGNGQTGEAATAVLLDPTVLVSDALGNPVPSLEVTFRPTGDGAVQASADTTDAYGLASTQWTLGTVAAAESDTLWAVVAGLDSVVFVATASAGAPAQLAFTVQPSSADQGATIFPAVEVGITDTLGNVVTSATDAVTLAIASGSGSPGATLSGSLTVNATNGVASFNDLSIDLKGSGYQLEATAAGRTAATSSAFDIRSANAVYWLGGDGNWSSAASWSRGAVPSTADTVTIDVTGDYTITLDTDAAVSRLELGAGSGTQVLAVNGYSLNVADSLLIHGGGTGHLEVVNAGTVTAGALVVDGVLLASGTFDAPIDNRGVVTVQGIATFNAGYQSAVGSQLTLEGSDADLTASTSFTNNGTITFNSTTCCGPPTLTIADGGVINNAAGSVIEVIGQDGAWINADISNGGTLTHAGASTLTLQGGTIHNIGTVSVSGGGEFAVDGALTNDGTIVVDSGLTVVSSGFGFFNTTTGVVTLGVDASLQLVGDQVEFDAGLTVDSSRWVYVYGGSGGATLTVTGDVVVQSGGVLDVLSTTLSADSIVNGGDLTLDNTVVNGPLDNQGLLTVQFPGGTLNGAFYTGSSSSLEIAGNAALVLAGGVPFSNHGSLLFSGTSGDAPSLQLSGSNMTNEAGGGVVTVQNGVDATLGDIGTFDNQSTVEVPSGSLTIAGSDIANNTLFDVSGGYLNLSPSTSLSNAGTLTVASGFEVAVTTPTPFENSGVIGGSGLVRPGDGGLSSMGTIAPGASPGTLTIDGDLTLASGGVLQLEINGPTPDTEHDVLIVSGGLTLGGTLEILKDGAYDPAAADTLGIVTFGSSSGAFAVVNGNDLGGGEILDLITGATDLRLARTTDVAAVTVSPAGGTINGLGNTTALAAAALGSGGDTLTGKTFTWISLNPDVASVDASGIVTAAAYGQVTIAVSSGGAWGYALVTVNGSGQTIDPINLWARTSTDNTTQLNGVYAFSPNDAWIAMNSAEIMRWDGSAWTRTATGLSIGMGAAWGTSSDNLVFPGPNGRFAHFDGSAWTQQSFSVTQTANGAWGSSPTDVMAVANDGILFHFDGAAWDTLPRPAVQWLHDVWGYSRDLYFAVGEAGTILRYDGAAWSSMTSPTASALTSVWGFDSTDVYAAGINGLLLHYDGTVWSTLSSGTGQTWRELTGIAGTDLYLIGNGGLIARWDGSAFSIDTIPEGSTLYDLAVEPNGGAWVVGANGVVYRGYRGATVALSPSDTTLTAIDDQVQVTANAEDGGGTPIAGVSFIWSSSDSSVAVPDANGLVTAVANGTATITATATGGASGNTTVTVQQVAASWSTSPATGMAPSVGSSFQFTTLEVLDHNGNVVSAPTFTWETLNSNVVTVDGTGTFTPVAAGQATIVTRTDDLVSYTVVTVTDPSLSPVNLWAPVGIGVTSNQLHDVWGTSSSDVWAVGDGGDILHFDGFTWSVTQTGGNTLNSVWGVSDTAVFAVGNLSTILHYDGASWTPMSNPAPAGIVAVWAATPEHAWAVGPTGLTLNFLNGSWSDATVNPALSFSGITGWSQGNALAVGSDGNGTPGVDAGAVQQWYPWTQLAGAPEALTGLWGSWMTDVFATGNSGGLYRYDGYTWSSSGTMSGGVPLAVSGTSPTDVYAVGVNGNISWFDGSNWTPMESGTSEQLEAVWAAPDGTVFVIGYNGTILRGFRDATVTVTPGGSTITAIGGQLQFTAQANAGGVPGVPDVTFTWSSSDSSVAVPDATGLVTSVGDGTATITATAPGGASGSTTVTVATGENLVGSAFRTWSKVLTTAGPTMALSVAASEHSSPWANVGMERYSRIPREASDNQESGTNVDQVIVDAWTYCYQAIVDVREGFAQLKAAPLANPADSIRALAFGKYMQGLAHGTIALLYDSGFVYDETIGTPLLDQPFQSHQAVMDAALAYFIEAIAIANSGTMSDIPSTWMGQTVTAADLVRLAHSEMARMRAGVARNPTERAAIDWNAVVTDANAGIVTDWDFVSDCYVEWGFCDSGLDYRNVTGWAMMANWIAGMADQSGAYQAWMATPTVDRMPFVLVTPDLRFPQGADTAAQLGNPGTKFEMQPDGERLWYRPDRGTWRWSYYRNHDFLDVANASAGSTPLITVAEMNSLKAEAAYRMGNFTEVAAYVNATRVAAGLPATDASGSNGSCVPKLPDGSCGNLWEMLKWEKRLETQFLGPLRIGWYLDGRGWGDLMEGTLLELPVPYSVMLYLGRTPYNLGGVGGSSAAPVGTYGY